MPKETDKKNAQSEAELAGSPVCNIDPALLQNNQSSLEQLCIKGMEEYDNGQMLRALQYYVSALSLKSDFIPALLGTTCVLVAMERYQEAQSYLDYVFELDPDIKDAKILRNIINNAKSGYPVFEETDHLPGNFEEEEIPPETSSIRKAKPFLIGLIVLGLCCFLASPLLKDKKTENPAPNVAGIRKSLAAEPALKGRHITLVRKGDEMVLSGQVSNLAERRLAVVITEQAVKPLPVNSNNLKIGEYTQPKPKSIVNEKNRTYIVKQGDTLSLIARKYYGDGNYWNRILDANQSKLSNPDGIKIGMELVIPE